MGKHGEEVNYRAPGKLMLTGEYHVLHGIPALAVPTHRGQELRAWKDESIPDYLHWESRDEQGKLWFWAKWSAPGELLESSDQQSAEFLVKLLGAAQKLGKTGPLRGYRVETRLDFPRHWGLGSSSTLTYLLAQWLKCPPLDLHFATQNGSGYDVAVALAGKAIQYRLTAEVQAVWEKVQLPDFWRNTSLIYRGVKQNSAREVQRFHERKRHPKAETELAAMAEAFLQCNNRKELEALMYRHEKLTGASLGQLPVQDELYPDYPGQLKSLGAWGGDFLWGSGNAEASKEYFAAKGLHTVLAFDALCRF